MNEYMSFVFFSIKSLESKNKMKEEVIHQNYQVDPNSQGM